MRVIIQKVRAATAGTLAIGRGYVVATEVAPGVTLAEMDKLAKKILNLKLFFDSEWSGSGNNIASPSPSVSASPSPSVSQSPSQDPSATPSASGSTTPSVSGKKPPKQLSVMDVNGSILCLPQVSLDVSRASGEPVMTSSEAAAQRAEAQSLFDQFVSKLKTGYKADRVHACSLDEQTTVSIQNDGPHTIILDTNGD